MRVLFWGTPDFAEPALRALIGEGFEVIGVVTQPDKPQGRSREIIPTPVKQIALDEEITVFQPKNARDPELLKQLNVMKPDISVVVAYGHILPKNIIDLPRLGTLNIHASLLPKLRGAAPIQSAIREGLSETGITIMRMVPALDAGPILLQTRTPILDESARLYGLESGRSFAPQVPVERLLEPEEVASLIAWLAGPGGRGTTGADFNYDGGMTI